MAARIRNNLWVPWGLSSSSSPSTWAFPFSHADLTTEETGFVYRQRFLARDSCGRDVAAVSSSLHSGGDTGSGWSGTG